MPHPFRDIYAVQSLILTQHNALKDRTVIIVGRRSHLSPKHNKRIILGLAPMEKEDYKVPPFPVDASVQVSEDAGGCGCFRWRGGWWEDERRMAIGCEGLA